MYYVCVDNIVKCVVLGILEPQEIDYIQECVAKGEFEEYTEHDSYEVAKEQAIVCLKLHKLPLYDDVVVLSKCKSKRTR